MTITIPEPSSGASTYLRVQRRNTEEFIKADPIVISLVPRSKTKTAGGGKKMVEGEPKTAQMFRLIPTSDVQPSVQTPDGIQLTPTFVLLGKFDADMARWDTFELNGHKYQIVSTVRPEHSVENRYESKADVARY